MIGDLKVTDELTAALRQLPDRLPRKVLMEALTDAAEPVREAMARLAPRGDKPPHLYQNIVVSPARSVDGVRLHDQEAAVAIGPDKRLAAHGVLQEFGTVHHGPQPFARPAWDGNYQKSFDLFGKTVWTALAARGIGRSQTVSGPISGGGGGRSL